MNFQNINQLIEYPKSGILSRQLFRNGASDATLFCLARNTDIADHTSVRGGYVLILAGQGIFRLAGEDIAMAPGVLIAMAPNAVHAISAAEDTSFLLILN